MKKNAHLGLLCLALCLLCWACQASHTDSTTAPDVMQEPDGEAPGVTVRGQVAQGSSAFYAAGVTVYRWESLWDHPLLSHAHDLYLERTQPGLFLVEFTWPQQEALEPPDAQTWDQWMQERYGALFTEILAAQGGLFLHIAGPPRWASSAPTANQSVLPFGGPAVWSRSPPEPADGSYPAWSEGMAAMARWIAREHPEALAQGRVVVGYGVELDNHEYYGDLRSYAPAYHAAATALRQNAPGLLVAGGGRLDAFAPKAEPQEHRLDRPALEVWLEGCQALGCPVDLVFGHNFTLLPTPWATGDQAPRDAYGDVQRSVQVLLERYGYGEAGLVLTDHTSWELHDRADVHPWLSSEHDTQYRAAHLASSLISMRRQGFAAHTIGTLFEQAGQEGDFVGDWGLFTTHGIAKPSFYAAALASALTYGELLDTAPDHQRHPFVRAEAARGLGLVAVLVVRFVPDTQERRMLLGAFGQRFLANGHSPQELIEALGGDGSDAQQRLLEILASGSTEGLQQPSEALEELFQSYFALQAQAQQAPELSPVTVALEGLDFEGEPLLYRVSATQANTYHHCVELAQDCSDPDAINRQAVALDPVALHPGAFDPATGRVTLEQERQQVDMLIFTLKP